MGRFESIRCPRIRRIRGSMGAPAACVEDNLMNAVRSGAPQTLHRFVHARNRPKGGSRTQLGARSVVRSPALSEAKPGWLPG